MQPGTGQTFDLSKPVDLDAAIRSVTAAREALVEVDPAEVPRLLKMSRQQRRAALRGRPKVEVEELKRLLAEARAKQEAGE